MDFFEAISFSTNLEREQYVSVLQLIEMVKHRNGVGIEKAVEFLEIARVAELCLYSCQRTFEKDFDYQSIGVNQELGRDIYGIACFEDIIRSDRSYQSRYEDELNKLNKQYFKRLDLLSLELIVKNTDIVTCGDRLVLQRMYSNIIQSNNDTFLALPQQARNAILEFLEPKTQNNDYVKSITQQLADEKKKVVRLIAEKEQAQSTGSFSMGTPTVAHGEDKTYEQVVEALTAANAEIKQHKQTINKLSDQIDKSTKDKLLPYNSQMSVAKMLYAILTEHNYDLSATKGKANSLIEKASQVHGTSVARNFIAKWIELANQAKSDSTK